jgi:hypothetical protein
LRLFRHPSIPKAIADAGSLTHDVNALTEAARVSPDGTISGSRANRYDELDHNFDSLLE